MRVGNVGGVTIPLTVMAVRQIVRNGNGPTSPSDGSVSSTTEETSSGGIDRDQSHRESGNATTGRDLETARENVRGIAVTSEAMVVDGNGAGTGRPGNRKEPSGRQGTATSVTRERRRRMRC
jgi:hypothetical protein